MDSKVKLVREHHQVAAGHRRAQFRAASVDPDARTAELIWTTGSRVMRDGWAGSYYEELSLDKKHVRMERLNNGAPLLDSHNGWTLDGVIGVVESARIEGDVGTARVRFSKAEDSPLADRVLRLVADGILRNISVGYSVYRYEKVEGGDDATPVYRAVDWEPFEISVVPMGADDGAGFRAMPSDGSSRAAPTLCEVITRAQEDSMDETTTTPAPAAAPAPVDTGAAAARADGARQERERIAGITAAVRAAKLDPKVAEDLIAAEISLDQARAKVIDLMAAADQATATRGLNPTTPATVIEDQIEKFMRGAQDTILLRSGKSGLMTQVKYDLQPGEYRGLRLVDLAREMLEISGTSTRGKGPDTIVRMALSTRSSITQSTSDFAILLENTMHKILLAAYETTPDIWSRVCAIGSVTDFRPHPRYRRGSFGKLDAVSENGEVKTKEIPDGAKASISATSKGNIINMTRQMIVNDDMSVFQGLTEDLGRAAKLSVELDFIAMLALNSGMGPTMADGKALFHTDHGNIVTTAGAPTVTTIEAGRVTMGSQKDISGNEVLDLRPSIWLGPLSLGGQARVANGSEYDPDANSKLQRVNAVRGLFTDVVDTARLTGTPWFMFAAPTVAPVFEVVFLNGEQSPRLESETQFSVDGVAQRVLFDYGIGATDWRGAVRNAGQ